MIMPKDNDTKFYLSLNYILNSLRFEEKDHLMKKDDLMDIFFKCLQDIQKEDIQKKLNTVLVNEKNFYKYQICDYCLILLTRPIMMEINKAMFINTKIELVQKLIDDNVNFIEELKENRQNTIQAAEYLHYIKARVCQ